LVPITKRSTVVRVPVLADYGPNVFLAACYVREKHFAQSQATLRVTLAERQLNVSIREQGAGNSPPSPPTFGGAGEPPNTQHPTPNTQHRYHPGDHITYGIQVTDSKGRPAPCEFSFGVVDEAIYALREDAPNALRDAFYPRRTNSVTTE